MTEDGETRGEKAPVAAGRWSSRQSWRPRGASGEGPWRPQTDPGTGQPFSEVLDLPPAAIATHVRRVRDGYDRSALPSLGERIEMLERLAGLIEAAAPDLGEIDALCTGKRLEHSLATAVAGARVLRYYASQLAEDPFSSRPDSVDQGMRQVVDRVPVGLVACILPWNFPLSQACARLAMLLASGNAGIYKGSELAQPPLLALEELTAEAGLPEWAFSVVTGGPEAGRALVEAEEIDAICFTGGVPTGLAIAETAARSLKRLVLELGGKTPFVVFADADRDAALEVALGAAFDLQGQACNAASLLLVERPVFDQFLDRFSERAAALRIGHQLAAATELGPMVSAARLERVAEIVDSAVGSGARLLTGGAAVSGLGGGFFYRPTVLSEVGPGEELARDEVFGPVVAALAFDREEEIVERVNGSPYGLAATIWTEDRERIERLRAALRIGQLYVNGHGQVLPNVPWGGFRLSGVGRLYGRDGLLAFTEARSTYVTEPLA